MRSSTRGPGRPPNAGSWSVAHAIPASTAPTASSARIALVSRFMPALTCTHAANERLQPRVHLLRLAMDGPTMAGQYPLESIIGELCERRAQGVPGIPARIAECNQ